MELRNPFLCETAKVRRLWQMCFHDPKPFVDYFFGEIYKPENTLALFEGGVLLSALQIFYYTAWHKGEKLKAAYIAGVSTNPTHRNKGYCTVLMNAAEERLRKENIDIITLIPFKFSFYEKYGYRCSSYLWYYKVQKNSKDFGEFTNSCHNADKYRSYKKFSEQFDFYFERDEKTFSEIEGDIKVCNGNIHEIPGGFLYYYREKRKIYVPEIVYEDEKVLSDLLNYVKSFGLPYTVRSGKNLLSYFSETDVKTEVKPHLALKELTPVGIKTGFDNYINMLGWV